ncbi:MATE family efflux transporter [Parashewanella curva]|uniref:MATE family efflux transporter n=1 Tax=Parashewanella curva TaxID=2338552 RepID=A0A3L8PZS0_9GAMM|nr:MATE family efflux transporter [Parashewanella curva]RLV60907.1 MATE family efflux transporter [Parashewanella curva]
MKDHHGILHAPIAPTLFKMTLPNLVGIFTVLSFNLIDTFFISRLGTHALTAISFTFPVTLLIVSIAIGIGAGVSTNFGRLIGAKKYNQARVLLHDALLISLLVTMLVCLIGFFSIDWLFQLLGAKTVSLPLLHDYMSIWYLGAPILVLLMVGNQGIRATGDTHTPAKIMVFSAILNAILDPLLIFGIGPFPRLEIQGAAIATLISWLIAFGFSGYIIAIKRKLIEFVDFEIKRVQHSWQRLAHIARPAAFTNLINPLANAVLMALLARLDHAAVAAFGAGTRIESILLMAVMALSSSLVPFIAQNLGAGKPERAKQALTLSLRFIFIFQCVLYIPVLLFSQHIALLFTQDPAVLHWLHFYLVALPLAYGGLGMIILFSTALNAYHRPMSSLVINLSRLFLLMLPLAFLGSYLEGVKGILLALPLTNIAMGFACYYLAKHISEPKPH